MLTYWSPRQSENGKGCDTCGSMRHHASICENPSKERDLILHQISGVPKHGQSLNQNAASFQNPTTSMFISSESNVLLQTAKANISEPGNGERFVNARIVFDDGSQRS